MTEPAPPTIDTFDLATMERRLCTEALRVAGGSINIAAKMLGMLTTVRIHSVAPTRSGSDR